jgi:transcriptional regulator with XRE-family HTH domain
MIDVSTTKTGRWRYEPLLASYNGVGFQQRSMCVQEEASVGSRILDMLERRGWSLGMLADRSGLNKGYLSQLTRGHVKNPGTVTLGKLATALGVDLSEITGERPMPRRRAEFQEGVARLPLRSLRVQADGRPTWDDTRDTIVVSGRAAFGRCMTPHVMPGDTVLIDPDRQPQTGDMVVVTDDSGDTVVKWYRVDPLGRPFLRAADGTELRPNGAKIEGVVFRVEREAVRDPEA